MADDARGMVRIDGRTPPHDLDAEAAVLSAITLTTDAFDHVADILKPEHFYSEAHRRMYEAAFSIRGRGEPLDMVILATALRDSGRLEQAGGMAYLTETINAAPMVANARRYAEIVYDKWLARQVIWVCQKYTARGYTEYGKADEYLNSIASDIYGLSVTDARSTTEHIKPVLEENLKDMIAASKAGRTITGLATGFDRFDRLTSGLHPGELTIIAARPGMGKTSLVTNILVNIAMRERDGGHPDGIILFSLEMPRKQIVDRMHCSEARVDLSRRRCGMLTPSDWPKLSGAALALSKCGIWIDDGTGMTLMQVRSKARRTMAEAERAGVRVQAIAVDYLQLMTGERGYGDSRETEVSGISRGLKGLAKEFNLPVIALAQLNRQSEQRGDKSKRPQLSDLRESGAIEQDADNVVFIYRDDYYNKESAERNVAELIVAKQRNGPTDTVKVRFDPQYTRFDNLPEGEFDDTERRFS